VLRSGDRERLNAALPDNEKARRKGRAFLRRTLVFQPQRGTGARMPLGI